MHRLVITSGNPLRGRKSPAGPQRFKELSSQVSSMQQQLLQFAEEKVQLGQQANDLLQMHNEELEKVGAQAPWLRQGRAGRRRAIWPDPT
jgi:hypothetical protein